MPEKLGGGGYADVITPLTEPLPKGDPRCPVNNPPILKPRNPLGIAGVDEGDSKKPPKGGGGGGRVTVPGGSGSRLTDK